MLYRTKAVALFFLSLIAHTPYLQAAPPCSPAVCVNIAGEQQCTPLASTSSCAQNEAVLALEGFGTTSSFGGGDGAETCTVTNLNNSGSGSFRECIENRNGPTASPVPRTIEFSVAGTIYLTADLRIRQPYLTIDGFSAPSPGITIAKTGNGENSETTINTWPAERTCGHDVLVQGMRFQGVWTRDTDAHSQNADNFGMDGEDYAPCMKNVVVWRNTFINGQDTVGGFWGSVKDSTFAYNFVLYNYHPQQISHWPGGVAGQERERLSIHHNIYAYAHDRIPNIRGNVWGLNLVQNVFHKWAAFGFGGGYATKFRCRGSGCPQRINLIENHWTSGGSFLNAAIEFQDGASPSQVYMRGNVIPSSENDRGTASQEFSNTDTITIYEDREFLTDIFPFIGHQSPTEEETQVKTEVYNQAISEL